MVYGQTDVSNEVFPTLTLSHSEFGGDAYLVGLSADAEQYTASSSHDMTEEELEALRGLGGLTREEQVSSLTKQAREEMEFKNRQFVGKLGHKHFSVKPGFALGSPFQIEQEHFDKFVDLAKALNIEPLAWAVLKFGVLSRHMALNHDAVHPSVVRHVRHAYWLHNVVPSLGMRVCLLASFRQLITTLLVEGDGTSLAETSNNREFAEFAERFREVAQVTLPNCVPCVSKILTEAIVGLRIAIGTVYPSLPRNSAARREKFGQPIQIEAGKSRNTCMVVPNAHQHKALTVGDAFTRENIIEQALLRRGAGEP